MQKHFNKLFLLLFVLVAITSTVMAQYKAQPSLYKRLGGYDAIAAVVDDFVPRLVADPVLGKFFAGHGINSRKHLRQLVVEKVCEATGGPCFYTGRTMKEAHDGLGVTEEQWNTSTTHLVETLDKLQVPKKEQEELLAVITSLKGDIVATATPAGEMKK